MAHRFERDAVADHSLSLINTLVAAVDRLLWNCRNRDLGMVDQPHFDLGLAAWCRCYFAALPPGSISTSMIAADEATVVWPALPWTLALLGLPELEQKSPLLPSPFDLGTLPDFACWRILPAARGSTTPSTAMDVHHLLIGSNRVGGSCCRPPLLLLPVRCHWNLIIGLKRDEWGTAIAVRMMHRAGRSGSLHACPRRWICHCSPMRKMEHRDSVLQRCTNNCTHVVY
ncbi:hypothetical protein ACLOJK_014898 [Asimina triloba]